MTVMSIPLPSTVTNKVDYTYLCTDLRTNRVLGEIPLSNVSLDCQLNSAGNFSGSGNLLDPKLDDQDFIFRTIPGRTALWAYRGNQIVWGGIIWTRQYQSNGKLLNLSGQTFESYATRRYPRWWLGLNSFTYNTGQASVMADLWHQMQTWGTGASIGVEPPVGLPSDDDNNVITLTVNGWDLSTSYDTYLQFIHNLIGGPDYNIEWFTDSVTGLPRKRLKVGTPIGNNYRTTGFVADFPGSIADYSFTEDATQGANVWWTQGSNPPNSTAVNNKNAPVGFAIDQASIDAGWPILENVDGDWSSITNLAQLNAYANADIHTFDMPALVHAADLFGQQMPVFGSYGLGDYIKFAITDPRFSRGYIFEVRVVGWTISPPDTTGGMSTGGAAVATGASAAGGSSGSSAAGSGLGVEVISLVFDDAGLSQIQGVTGSSFDVGPQQGQANG